MLQMLQALGDAGKVGVVRRGCHATDAGPPTSTSITTTTTTGSVRASIHGTSTAEHGHAHHALRRINHLSTRGLCIRTIPSTFFKSQVQL
jgi:hypothetical protein